MTNYSDNGSYIPQSDSTTPIQSGSNISYPLQKEVISNQRAKGIFNATFNEIAISEENFDGEKIKRIYNDLFFQIPKRGKKSHESIVIQSTDYVYPEINKNLDSNIKIVEQEISVSSSILLQNLHQNHPQEHPVYSNGLFLQEGDPIDNVPINPTSPIWFVQEGYKREIKNPHRGYWIRILRQAMGEDPYTSDGHSLTLHLSPNYRLLISEDLNTIPDGEAIEDGPDFSIHPLQGIEQTNIYSEIKLELNCWGQETFYKFSNGETGYDYDLSGYPETGGYWWMDTDASCEAYIETDIDPTLTFEPSGQSLIWKGKKYITISRDPKFYGHTINGTNDPLDKEFYNGPYNKVMETRQGWGMDLPKVEVYKQWGENSTFPAIINVKPGSKIAYRILSPTSDGTAGGAVYPGSHHLSGIVSGINSYYNQYSDFGTRMINNMCYGPLDEDGCYGKLGQNSNLNNLLSNPHNYYYLDNANNRKTFTNKFLGIVYNRHKVRGKIYGQPILKVNGKYCVFLETYRVRATALHYDYNVFINLHNGNIFRVKNKDLDNKVTGYVRNSDDLFNWLPRGNNPQYLNNPTLYYPGLQAYSINFKHTDLDGNTSFAFQHDFGDDTSYSGGNLNKVGGQIKDNPFNPKDGGSNNQYILKTIIKS